MHKGLSLSLILKSDTLSLLKCQSLKYNILNGHSYLPVKNQLTLLKEDIQENKHSFCVAELILNERIYKTRNPWSQNFNILILHITGQRDTGPHLHIS